MQTIAIEFEVSRFCRILRCPIINFVSDGLAPRVVTTPHSGAFHVSLVSPHAVTAGVEWMPVTTRMLLTEVVVDE